MMDLYITDSLQDMLDIDIKSEMATDLGSANDFAVSFDICILLLFFSQIISNWIITNYFSVMFSGYI